MDRETYDRTIETLNAALNDGDIDRRERGEELALEHGGSNASTRN